MPTPSGAPDSSPVADCESESVKTTAWHHQGLESLVARFRHIDAESRPVGVDETDVDLVIVGSGYGAAVAARELAGCRVGQVPNDRPLSICILERGSEYLRGAFPSRLADLPGHVRFSTPHQNTPRGVRTGLFDVRVGGDVMAIVASGVGGGSLINAGVMLEPSSEVMQLAPWPDAVRKDTTLQQHFDTVRDWLGAGPKEEPNTVKRTSFAELGKTQALMRLDRKTATEVPITVALHDNRESVAGVPLKKCVACGDCATGCNHGAKISLDVGLLAQACATEGVNLYTGATVLRLEKLRGDAGWVVVIQHTDDQLRARQGTPFRLRSKRVILAAGTLGSTEILLRSQGSELMFSSLLGQRFSTNGDLIASVQAQREHVNAVADEDSPPARRQVGPTITAMLDLRRATDGFVVQDLGVPGPLQQAFAELFATGDVLHGLTRPDREVHRACDPDPCAVAATTYTHSLPVAMIGHDGSDGRLHLVGDAGGDAEGDGALRIDWPQLKDDPRWPQQHARLETIVAANPAGGHVLPNPLWQLLPDSLQRSLDVPKGTLVTVHPLGGCPMGEDARSGVVSDIGCVFDASDVNLMRRKLHAGLVVLDGSIIPTSLGVNPALTIAVLARRAAITLRDAVHWSLGEPQPHSGKLGTRPALRVVPDPPPVQPTRIELVERMSGHAMFVDGETRWLELTLYSKPTPLRDLMQPAAARELVFDAERSTLRVFAREPERTRSDPTDEEALAIARVGGTLRLFQREPSCRGQRIFGAIRDWLPNRGVRDGVQRFLENYRQGKSLFSFGFSLSELFALASHQGAARHLGYEFTVASVVEQAQETASPLPVGLIPIGSKLAGFKRLAYGRAASPLTQLMEMTLTQCPGLRRGARPVLSLQLPFLAQQSVPLLRIVGQQDQATALADMAAFVAYVARILIDGHLWSFRKPDAPAAREPQRLPGFVPDAPPPCVIELSVATKSNGMPVHIRLTRYCPNDVDSDRPPILMIHGYSAGGTTFAHPTLEPGLMRFMTQTYRRDVWVLDMRSSCGMPTSTDDWTFEDMGCEDIPLAVDYVCRTTGHEQVDIVAHCMGVAMLFMGLLGNDDAQLPPLGQYPELRNALWKRNRIRRLAMSQVGPALLLTPANVARSYLMRYVKQFIVGGQYEFRPGTGLVGELLDRLFAALPYPEGEFARENPWWPPGKYLPWVGTRHRIDALFGRVFNLAHMSDATLACIDDFFGPFSVETVSQVMYFARYRMITDSHGCNRFVEPARLQERLTFPMLSLHSKSNGLADWGTKLMFDQVLKPNLGVGGTLESKILSDDSLGHQDALIGKRTSTREMFDEIGKFLQRP